jgi:hypothetical protein
MLDNVWRSSDAEVHNEKTSPTPSIGMSRIESRRSEMARYKRRTLISWGILVLIIVATLVGGILTSWHVGVFWASSGASLTLAIVNLLLGAKDKTYEDATGDE